MPDATSFQFVDGLGAHAPGTFAAAIRPGLGFSLSYAGRGGEVVSERLELADADPGAADRQRARFADAETGLQILAEYDYYPEHAAVVFGGEIVNSGPWLLPHVTDLCSVNLAFADTVVGSPTVHVVGGGMCEYMFPPRTFQLDSRTILGSMPPTEPFRIDSGPGGRSSDSYAPFYYLEDGQRRSGIYGGLGWSGLWEVAFFRQDGWVRIRGGIRGVDTTLRPGERLRMPPALLGFYAGSIADGRNRLRRFLSTWLPSVEGQEVDGMPFGAPVNYNHWFTFGVDIDDGLLRRQVNVCAELGVEYFHVDAGSYPGTHPEPDRPGSFSSGLGNWEVNLTKFPKGMRPFADYVRSKGLRYATWFEPERAHRASSLVREHPDWVLFVDGSSGRPGRRGGRDWGLVDFGRADVQEHFITLLSSYVEKWGIDWLKWDMNVDPAPYWALHDSPLHQGLHQLRHVAGVYRVWEELARRFPGLVLENCASGGRRLDLATLRRAHIHFSSDFSFHTDVVRNQVSGLNAFLPSWRALLTCTLGGAGSQRLQAAASLPEDLPDTYFHSRFGAGLRLSQDFASWSKPALARVRQHIDVYKSIRRYLRGDFYPLFSQPRSLDAWDGWQFDDPASGEGFVLCFRLPESPEGERWSRLHGLATQRRYRFEDPHGGAGFEATGEDLMERGIRLSLPPSGSRLLRYRPG